MCIGFVFENDETDRNIFNVWYIFLSISFNLELHKIFSNIELQTSICMETKQYMFHIKYWKRISQKYFSQCNMISHIALRIPFKKVRFSTSPTKSQAFFARKEISLSKQYNFSDNYINFLLYTSTFSESALPAAVGLWCAPRSIDVGRVDAGVWKRRRTDGRLQPGSEASFLKPLPKDLSM